MDDVELRHPGAKVAPESKSVGSGFGEGPGAHQDELQDVVSGTVLRESGHAEGIRLTEEVEGGDPVEEHTLIEIRVRRPGEDLDMVAEVDELTCEVSRVDALTTGEGVTPVEEECDPERATLWNDPAIISQIILSLDAPWQTIQGEASKRRRGRGRPDAPTGAQEIRAREGLPHT